MSPPVIEVSEISDKQINIVRSRFVEEATAHPELYLEADVNSIKTNERYLRRFLRSQKCDTDKAFTTLVTAMKWRKSSKLDTLDETELPREYFEIGGIFPYGKDKTDSTMLVFRVKMNKKFNEWTDLLKRYILYLVEREEKRAIAGESAGVTVVFDCHEAGISNVDIDLLSYIVALLRDYYPGLLTSVLVVDLPWILQWVFKLVQTWLPEEQRNKIQLVKDYEDLLNYVNVEELPDFMNGKNVLTYRSSPKTAPTIQEIADKRNIKKKDTEKVLKYLEQFLTAGQKL